MLWESGAGADGLCSDAIGDALDTHNAMLGEIEEEVADAQQATERNTALAKNIEEREGSSCVIA